MFVTKLNELVATSVIEAYVEFISIYCDVANYKKQAASFHVLLVK